MGTRFLAVLAVVALGAGSAMVGLTMASGSWTVAGAGLEPGQGYALHLGSDADRLKLELANLTGDAVASFAVLSPAGERVGFYALDASTKSAEVSAGAGDWLVFVYKSQGGDLTLSFHGANAEAGKFAPAVVERREFTLGSVSPTRAVDAEYTAIVGKAPLLANVVLQGSARNFHSELSSDKGVVEINSISDLAGTQGGGIVDSKGERTTMPQNLASGAYTAKVKADSLSGSLVLVALFLSAPDFPTAAPAAPDAPEDATPPTPPASSGPHQSPHAKHKQPHAAHAAIAKTEVQFAECGTAASRVPNGLTVGNGAMLKLTLEKQQDPAVSLYDPADKLFKVVELKKEGQSATVQLPQAGEYVLYARGADVKVELAGVEKCELRELKVQPLTVATVSGDALLGASDVHANFSLLQAPLEFGVRLASPDAVALGMHAAFKGPDGVAAEDSQDLGTGALGGSGGLFQSLPFGSPDGNGPQSSRGGLAQADAQKLVDGDYVLDLQAQLLRGDVEAFALQYLREASDEGK